MKTQKEQLIKRIEALLDKMHEEYMKNLLELSNNNLKESLKEEINQLIVLKEIIKNIDLKKEEEKEIEEFLFEKEKERIF